MANKSLNILLVDDSASMIVSTRIIIRHSLKELGYNQVNVEFAEDGAQGLEKIRQNSNGAYDLIISDYQMPMMDGLEFYQKLTSEQQRKVIFRTADPEKLEEKLSMLQEPHYKEPSVLNKLTPDIIDNFKQAFLKYLGSD